MGLILGMDTGGTFTDAVLLDKDSKTIIKKAKAPTTKEDLCIGIRESIEALDYENMSDIGLVCLSTTLATNSIVEGKGCRVGLVITGKRPYEKLPEAEIVQVGGALDIRGRLQHDLDENYARKVIRSLAGKVDAVAVSGYACVRNPEHEIIVRRLVREELDVPVVCAHELTCELGYYERTVTVILNARLIPLIKRLIDDTRICLEEMDVHVPIMVVRGDGSYMDSEYAVERPVETILSGPAASIKGAMFLSGLDEGTIIDMGGTTSDIAMLKGGKVGVSMEGAKVGGWRTRVKAIDVYTCGIGGDSRISFDNSGNITIGPDKIIPVSYASSKGLAAKIEEAWMSVQEHEYRSIFGMSESRNDIGLTPTDIAHAAGLYDAWDKGAVEACLKELCEKMNIGREALLAKLINAFGGAVTYALEKSGKTSENVPVVALGAPSESWMPVVLKDSRYELVVPELSEVANAVGAAIGEIEEVVKILVRQDELTGRFIGYSRWFRREYDTLEEAKVSCVKEAERYAAEESIKCGCVAPNIFSDVHDEYCESYDGKRKDWIETVITAVATGEPRFI